MIRRACEFACSTVRPVRCNTVPCRSCGLSGCEPEGQEFESLRPRQSTRVHTGHITYLSEWASTTYPLTEARRFPTVPDLCHEPNPAHAMSPIDSRTEPSAPPRNARSAVPSRNAPSPPVLAMREAACRSASSSSPRYAEGRATESLQSQCVTDPRGTKTLVVGATKTRPTSAMPCGKYADKSVKTCAAKARLRPLDLVIRWSVVCW